MDVVLAAVSVEDLAPPGSPPGDGHTPATVLLTGERRPVWTQDAVRLGVRALLSRDASAEEILAAVEAAASGMAVVDPRELETLLASAAPAPASAEAHTLTARELEVLRMMAGPIRRSPGSSGFPSTRSNSTWPRSWGNCTPPAARRR